MDREQREAVYMSQRRGSFTPRQRRRLDHKANYAAAKTRRAEQRAEAERLWLRTWLANKGR